MNFSVGRFVQLCFLSAILFAPQILLGQGGYNGYVYTPSNVTIYRDTFGIPHIHGKTDADVAYGLAWANSEDDFKTLQQTLIAGRMRLGEVLGIPGAGIDYAGHLLRARERGKELYEKELSPQFRFMMDAQSQGFNAYAKLHPEQCLLKDFFPITPLDLAASYVLNTCLISGLMFDLPKLLKGKLDGQESNDKNKHADAHNPTGDIRTGIEHWLAQDRMGSDYQIGSNALAMNAKRTQENNTFLLVNSHQPLEGPLSWYECHLISDEGWNTYGGTFPAGLTIFHGANANLGWAHTTTVPDVVDVYNMRINPKDKNQYWFDGKWENFEVGKAPLKVKLGGLKISVKREILWCKYGPALRTKHGVYAIRLGNLFTIRTLEQWYHMNKAKNLEEFRQAVSTNSLPRFNITYADAKDNIYYTVNAIFPKRAAGYQWEKVLPGDTSATLWNSYLPFSEMPQILNPSCGYVMNTNQPFYLTTCTADAPSYNSVDPTTGFEKGHNNRSLRMMQLLDSRDKHSYQQIQDIKFDQTLPDTSAFLTSIRDFWTLDPAQYPEAAPTLNAYRSWNKRFDAENPQAGMVVLAMWYLFKTKDAGARDLRTGLTLTQADVLAACAFAQKEAKKLFGGYNFKYGDLLFQERSGKKQPIGGFPDVLAAMTGFPVKKGPDKGKFRAFVGDSFMMFVRWDANGKQTIEALNAYGQSNDPKSPHHTDQMDDFAAHRLRPVHLDLPTVQREAVRSYHPGQ
jgi:acyl-homoserine-lactone acylase